MTSRWASARGRRVRISTSRACSPSAASATGCRASCASTARASPASTPPATRCIPPLRARRRRRTPCAARSSSRRCSASTRVVTMSGCPGGRGDGDSTGVFAVSWLCCDDEPLWEWQFREHVVPFWRELSTWAATPRPACASASSCTPGVTIFGAESFRAPARRGRARTSASTSTRATSGGRASTRSRSSSSTATRSASRTARTRCCIPTASARTACSTPATRRPGHGLLALRRRRRRPPDERVAGAARRAARGRLRRRGLDRARGPEACRPRPRSRPRRRPAGGARMAVTLNDVARRAGVSKSTVSNVVRGATPVVAGHAQARRGGHLGARLPARTRSRARSSSAPRARSAWSSPTPSTRSPRRSRRRSCGARAATATPS